LNIVNLNENSAVYTSNTYLLTGEWKTMDDVNTIIDVGRDAQIIGKINKAATGVGKQRIDQIILTHNHYDHATLTLQIKKRFFNPVVYAFSATTEGVDRILKNGDTLRIADRMFEIIHTPGHSSDSICLYCPQDEVLFAGDTPLVIQSSDSTYEPEFIAALKYIVSKKIKSIYFGHGPPLLERCEETLLLSYRNSLNSI